MERKKEEKWQNKWREARIFEARPGKKKKFYCLEMFPYPSGELHIGHVRNYCIADCVARFKRMQGYNVLYPIGFDAFGLPAENAAIKYGIRPDVWTERNIADMKKQLKQLGFSYDWSREIVTCRPSYYKWQQLFFLRAFQKNIAYKKKARVNFCPSCQTVLANEQVHEGKCWRCETKIEEKELEQWFFNTTRYAEELLEELKKLDWPEKVKTMQKNWIGKSNGAIIIFKTKAGAIEVFTTRPDTLFGCTFLAISPEHPLAFELMKEKHFLSAFLEKIRKKSSAEREEKGKEGIFTGSYAINPINNKNVPIYIAEYILPEYGTGAIMCVPAHDVRDYEFAKTHRLPIVQVIKKGKTKLPYEGEGKLINSGKFNNMESEKARKEIVKELQTKQLARFATCYRLKDWLISRQRYWGCPIPVVYCDVCGIVPVPEHLLPVLLPSSDKVEFGKGNPLETCEEFVNTNCPRCGKKARRETDTMDTFVDSSWYFLRYCSAKQEKKPFDEEVEYWMPVDFYVGGIEHACMHLIYARAFMKMLSEIGFLKKGIEPFSKLLCQGMVLKEGKAMSKSKGNVVSIEEMLQKYNADTIRLFELSSALPESDIEFSEKGMQGISRFLEKAEKIKQEKAKANNVIENYILAEKNLLVKRVTEEIENLRLNIAISLLFSFFDKFSFYKKWISKKAFDEIYETFVLLLSPFSPHLAEELWHKKHKSFISTARWPKAKKFFQDNLKIGTIIENTTRDIRTIIKIMKKKKPSSVYIYCLPRELKIFLDLKEIFSEILKLKIEIFASSDKKRYDPQKKAKKAKAGRPAIYVE